MWGATTAYENNRNYERISIHAPRVGSDPPTTPSPSKAGKFQSTLPVWGATKTAEGVGNDTVFQSTLPVWGATNVRCSLDDIRGISIHAPRVGSDLGAVDTTIMLEVFQSTLPVWGATTISPFSLLPAMHFNPRSPCGERHCGAQLAPTEVEISIHAPRVGSDTYCYVLQGD